MINISYLNQIYKNSLFIKNKKCSLLGSEQKKFLNHLFGNHLTTNLFKIHSTTNSLCLSPVEADSLTSNNPPPSTDLEYQILVRQQPSLLP